MNRSMHIRLLPFLQGTAQKRGLIFGGIAGNLIDRFFRTLKTIGELLSRPAFLRPDLERRLRLAFDYYAWLRPHQGLGGATPAELYRGQKPGHLDAVSPPRGQPGEGPPFQPSFKIHCLDPERRLPYLVPKIA